MAEPLIGPQPIIGAGDSPDKVGGNAPTTEYKPIDEAGMRAINGINPATGNAYTDADIARLNGGYVYGAEQGGPVGYQIDPRSGNLNILYKNGMVATTGARYRETATGAIVPQKSSLPPGVGVDENGKTYQPGEVMPSESLEEYVARMASIGGSGNLVYKGKNYQFDQKGEFYIPGEQDMPFGFGTPNNIPGMRPDGTMASNVKIGNSSNVNQSGTTNPFAPGSEAAKAWNDRKSAYDLLYSEFDRYGLSSLVTPLKELITSGASPSEFTIRIRETDAYKKRFAANETRIKNGLRALSEAEYIRNEDNYQEVMRRRGLPPEYYAKGDLGVQKGFDALLAGDVSSAELEDRIVTAQDRVLNASPEIAAQLKQFYPGISNGDILAYTLDPANAINQIKRKITAAEIGAAAGAYGLGTTVGRAEQLAGAGVTEATAQQGFKTISQVGPRAGVLAQYYKQDPYTQETAEKEFFGLTGAREAEMQRKKLTQLETAAFSGSAGAGAIARDRAGVL
jgi:hypothetical protein